MSEQTLFPDVHSLRTKLRQRWLAFAPIHAVSALLQSDSLQNVDDSFVEQQQKDYWIRDMFVYLEQGILPVDESSSRRVSTQGVHFAWSTGFFTMLTASATIAPIVTASL